MDKEKYKSSLSRLALIAAGGTAAVVTFTGGIASAATAAHPAAVREAVSVGIAGAPIAVRPAAQYVTSLVSSTGRPNVPTEYSQYSQELPFTLIYEQSPFGQV